MATSLRFFRVNWEKRGWDNVLDIHCCEKDET